MSTDEVRQLLGEGAQLMKEGKLGEAIAKLKSAADLDPSSVQARSYLGAAYARDGQGPASVEQFQAAVDLDPDNPVHNFNLGQAFEVAGSKPRAMQLYEKALALDPKYAKARQRLDACGGSGRHSDVGDSGRTGGSTAGRSATGGAGRWPTAVWRGAHSIWSACSVWGSTPTWRAFTAQL